jgi:hypothetical protein
MFFPKFELQSGSSELSKKHLQYLEEVKHQTSASRAYGGLCYPGLRPGALPVQRVSTTLLNL